MAQIPLVPGQLEQKLKKSMSLPQSLAVAFHQIVGAGIVALTGVAIALTGGGAPIAFVLAAVAVIIYSIPYAALASAMPMTGGMYRYPTRIFNPSLGYAVVWMFIALEASISIYALTAAQYIHALFPTIPSMPVAVGILTLFFLLNLAGAAISSSIGVVMAVIMVAAFLTYVGFGIPHIHWATFSNLAPNGVTGLLTAAALMTFATGGGTVAAELGGEMKKPHRDIPIAIIGGTVVAAILYVLIVTPSTSVLPIKVVAGQPLTLVAQHTMPYAVYLWFIVGGAIMAVIATMNAALLWGTKSVLMAVEDGWFPKGMGAVNKRFGTPHFLLLILYAVGLVPILTGLNIGIIASAGAGFGQLIFIAPIVGSYVMRHRFPELVEKAPFKLNRWLHLALVVLAVMINCYLAYLLFKSLTGEVLIALAVWVAAGVAWYAIRYPRR
ncbi:MAG: APC family permease, partial [Candidatus Dormiibacterota bacterium]